MIFAFKFDENQIKEKRFPKINELDKVFPNLPVLLRRVDGHSCVINSYAKNIIGKLYPKINLNFSIFTKEENDFIVVLDPGHGGKDPGTSSNGVKEKNVVLKLVLLH